MSNVNELKDACKIGTNIQFKRKVTTEAEKALSDIELAPGEPLFIPALDQLRIGKKVGGGTAADADTTILGPASLDANSTDDGAELVFTNSDQSTNTINIKGTNGVSVTFGGEGNITLDSDYDLSIDTPQTPNNAVTLNLSGKYGNDATKSSVTFVGSDNLSITKDGDNTIKLNGVCSSGDAQGQIKFGNTIIDIQDLQTGSTPTFAAIKLGDDENNTLTKAQYSGNAITSSKWLTPIKITLTGAVTGEVTDVDGSANVSINTTVNHNHDNDYVNVSGDTMTGNLIFNEGNGICGTMAGSDTWSLFASNTDTDSGYVELKIQDNGDEPFYIRNYGTSGNKTGEVKIAQGSVTASSFTAISDKRLKENIVPYTSTKNTILDLPIYKFDFINNGKKNNIGCLAQDLQNICPEIVHEDPNTGYLSIEESKIVYLLLHEVKQLRKELDELKRG